MKLSKLDVVYSDRNDTDTSSHKTTYSFIKQWNVHEKNTTVLHRTLTYPRPPILSDCGLVIYCHNIGSDCRKSAHILFLLASRFFRPAFAWWLYLPRYNSSLLLCYRNAKKLMYMCFAIGIIHYLEMNTSFLNNLYWQNSFLYQKYNWANNLWFIAPGILKLGLKHKGWWGLFKVLHWHIKISTLKLFCWIGKNPEGTGPLSPWPSTVTYSESVKQCNKYHNWRILIFMKMTNKWIQLVSQNFLKFKKKI